MASSFLKKKAEQARKRVDHQYGADSYGGSNYDFSARTTPAANNSPDAREAAANLLRAQAVRERGNSLSPRQMMQEVRRSVSPYAPAVEGVGMWGEAPASVRGTGTAKISPSYGNQDSYIERMAEEVDATNLGFQANFLSKMEQDERLKVENALAKYYAGEEPGYFEKLAVRNLLGTDSVPSVAGKSGLGRLAADLRRNFSTEGWDDKLPDVSKERIAELSNFAYSEGDRLAQEAAAMSEHAREGLGKLGTFGLDLTGMAADQIGRAALSTVASGPQIIPPGASKLYDLARQSVLPAVSYQSQSAAATREKLNEGYSLEKAKQYGALSGAASAAIEGIGGFGASDILQNGMSKAAGRIAPGVMNAFGRFAETGLGKIATGALSEGMEELIEAPVNTLVGNAVLGENEKTDWGEALKGAGMAAILGAAGGGANALGQRLGANSQKNYQFLKQRDNGQTPDFDAQWERANSDGRAGVPYEQTTPLPSQTPIDEATRRAAYDAGTNDRPTPGLSRDTAPDTLDSKTADALDRIAKKTGSSVVFDGNIVGVGEYKDGVIRINPSSPDPVRQVFVHELTHHLEQSGDYQAFADVVKTGLANGWVNDTAMDLDKMIDAKIAEYAEYGQAIDRDSAGREVIAEFADEFLFTDEASIKRLARENSKLHQRVLNWIRDMLAKFKGRKDSDDIKFLRDAEQMYIKAAENVQKNSTSDGEVRNKIGRTVDNRSLVEVDRDILGLQPTAFTEKETVAAKSANPSPGAARNTATISDNSVPQKKPADNGNTAQNSAESYDGQRKLSGSSFFKTMERAGYAEEAKALRGAVDQYGAFETGETPTRNVTLPRQMDDDTRVSRFARTAAESGQLSDEQASEIGKAVAEGRFNYTPTSDKSVLDSAQKKIDNDPSDALRQWRSKFDSDRQLTKADIALGEQLIRKAAQDGDTKTLVELTAEVAAAGTRAGQMVQAMRLLKSFDGSGQLVAINKEIAAYQRDLDKKYGKKAPVIKVSDELKTALAEAKTDAEIAKAKDDIFKSVADQTPSNWEDKWNAWRYLAMLGNVRTHVRNIAGNAVFAPVVAVKNKTGAVIETTIDAGSKALGKGGIERTKTIKAAKGGAAQKAAMDFAKADYQVMKDMVSNGGKYDDRSQIEKYRKVFRGNNPLSKALETARTKNSAALEFEDALFLNWHYTRAMQDYILSNNIDPRTLGDEANVKTLDRARAYATREAQRATYRDASKTADLLSKVSRQGNPLAKTVIEGVLPFKKTPLNIMKRGVEYSPAGIVKAVYKAWVGLKNGTYTANELADDLAATFTGTALVALGGWLASLGLLTGADDEDDKSAAFRDMNGYQTYAFQFDGKSYTIDWAAPGSMPLFVGAEAYKYFRDKENYSWGDALSALETITAPMNDMSMLSGLNSTLDHLAYSGDTSNALMNLLSDAAISYASQAIPTLGGQIARTVDPVRRTTYPDKNNQMPDTLERALQKARNKIPMLSKGSLPYIDQWGETETDENNLLVRAAYNMLSPGYASEVEKDALDTELLRLYDETGEDVFPGYHDKSVRYKSETIHFTPEQYKTYATTSGQTAHQLAQDIIENENYDALPDIDRASAMTDLYEYARAIAKTAVVKGYELDGWHKKAYEGQKVGLEPTDYALYRLALKAANEDGNTSYNQAEAEAAINSLKGLNRKQKSYLWQSTNSQWSDKKNPFDTPHA